MYSQYKNVYLEWQSVDRSQYKTSGTNLFFGALSLPPLPRLRPSAGLGRTYGRILLDRWALRSLLDFDPWIASIHALHLAKMRPAWTSSTAVIFNPTILTAVRFTFMRGLSVHNCVKGDALCEAQRAMNLQVAKIQDRRCRSKVLRKVPGAPMYVPAFQYVRSPEKRGR